MKMDILNDAIKSFVKKMNDGTEHYDNDWVERKERCERYSKVDEATLANMGLDDFYEYMGKLWAMMIWGNKKYYIDKLIDDNGFVELKDALVTMLYGNEPIEKRWDEFMNSIKGVGPATVSELLTYVHPKECAIMNSSTIKSLRYLGIEGLPKYNYQQTGQKYVELCNVSKAICEELKKNGIEDADLLVVDYFMWDEILPQIENASDDNEDDKDEKRDLTANDSKSLHNEIRDKIVIIGELLGFESSAEIKVAEGAVVDAVWEAKIGNMGKAIYVFEVQSNGSIDSLILNLKKAQSNAAVQAVVAVSDSDQLTKIIKESKGVIDEETLRTWEFDDVLAVHDSLVRAHESINRLALVPDSFC